MSSFFLVVMTEQKYFTYTDWILLVPLGAVLSIWTVYWAELQFGINLNEYGVYPRTLKGLRGIVFSPFLHASVEHLYNNTIPLAILLAALVYFYRSIALRIVVGGVLLSGLVTWAIGRPSYHIGASGVIYLLASFIFFKGIFTKHYRLVALSLIVVFVYGSLLWYIFPVKEDISWEGHLGGFLSGLLLAMVVKAKLPVVKKYDWEHEDYPVEDDVFLQHFDEDGNFIEQKENGADTSVDSIQIIYEYKERKTDS